MLRDPWANVNHRMAAIQQQRSQHATALAEQQQRHEADYQARVGQYEAQRNTASEGYGHAEAALQARLQAALDTLHNLDTVRLPQLQQRVNDARFALNDAPSQPSIPAPRPAQDTVIRLPNRTAAQALCLALEANDVRTNPEPLSPTVLRCMCPQVAFATDERLETIIARWTSPTLNRAAVKADLGNLLCGL